MTDLKLLPDEGLLLQSDSVERGGKKSSRQGELYLTNRHLIYVDKGYFGKVKSIDKYPVETIKMVNGRVQIFVRRNSLGSIPQLEVHLIDEILTFEFESFVKKQAEKWLQAISDLRLRGPNYAGSFENTSDIQTSQFVSEFVQDTVSMIRKAWTGESPQARGPVQVAAKCQGCGASLSGYEGMIVRCLYCNSEQKL